MKRLILLLSLALVVVGLSATAAIASSTFSVPVSGKVVNHPGASFKGRIVNPEVTYSATRDVLKVNGTLKGTLTRANGTTEAVTQTFNTRAVLDKGGDVSAQATCPILDLDIGRIHLDLLGLVVNLAPIHLNIDAISGTGNLLGNLLCSLAGLLDPTPSSLLADFLNQLLALLYAV